MLRLIVVGLLLVAGMGSAGQAAAIPRFTETAVIDLAGDYAYPGAGDQMAFSPDGASLASGMVGGVGIWELATGELVRTLPEDFTVAWSPDGRWLTTGGKDYGRAVRLWDAETGELRGEFSREDVPTAYYSSWSPDSSRFATDAGQVIDVETGEVMMELGETWPRPHGVLWSPDGKRIGIFTQAVGYFLNIWSAESGELLDAYASRFGTWGPDGLRIATEAQIRDATTGLPTVSIPQLHGDMAWSPDGLWIVSTRIYGYYAADTIYAWSPMTGELLTTLTIPDCSFSGVAWNANGSRLASTCYTKSGENYSAKIYVWDVDEGGERALHHPSESTSWFPGRVPGRVVDTEDQQYRAVDNGEDIFVYEMPGETLIDTLEGYGLVSDFHVWRSDGQQLVVVTRGGDEGHGPKYIWTVGEGLSAPIYNATDHLWWLEGSMEVVTASDNWMLRFYDATDGRLLRTIRHTPVDLLAIGDLNDQYLLTFHGNAGLRPSSATVTVWSLDSFEPVLTAPMIKGTAYLEGNRLYVIAPGEYSMEYDLTGQNAPVRRDE